MAVDSLFVCCWLLLLLMLLLGLLWVCRCCILCPLATLYPTTHAMQGLPAREAQASIQHTHTKIAPGGLQTQCADCTCNCQQQSQCHHTAQGLAHWQLVPHNRPMNTPNPPFPRSGQAWWVSKHSPVIDLPMRNAGGASSRDARRLACAGPCRT